MDYETYAASSEIKQNPQKIVICLHGLGASPDDLIPFAKIINDQETLFIFPKAPIQAVTINAGMHMPAWYDIYGIGPSIPEDEQGIKNSSNKLCDLIKTLKNNHPNAQTKLIGFSQGGAIALYTALTNPELCTGVLGLSTYLPLAQKLIMQNLMTQAQDQSQDQTNNKQKLNIALMHGTNDETISIKFAELTQVALQQLGFNAPLTTYSMGHEICPEQIPDIKDWLYSKIS